MHSPRCSSVSAPPWADAPFAYARADAWQPTKLAARVRVSALYFASACLLAVYGNDMRVSLYVNLYICVFVFLSLSLSLYIYIYIYMIRK